MTVGRGGLRRLLKLPVVGRVRRERQAIGARGAALHLPEGAAATKEVVLSSYKIAPRGLVVLATPPRVSNGAFAVSEADAGELEVEGEAVPFLAKVSAGLVQLMSPRRLKFSRAAAEVILCRGWSLLESAVRPIDEPASVHRAAG